MLSLIVAIDENYAIGKAGGLLCHLPDDLRHFQAITLHSTVIMGEKTFFSLPRHPLPNRRNIVITDRVDFAFEGTEAARSIEEAMDKVRTEQEAFIIGGGSIYRQMLPYARKLYITHIHHAWEDADTFFPRLQPTDWQLLNEEHHPADARNPYPYTFAEYARIDPQ